jgi:hypothetical protein
MRILLALRFFVSLSFLAMCSCLAVAQPSPRSAIGVNLNQVSFYSPQQPFLNLFKNGSLWITGSFSRGLWDTGEQSKLALDPNGWPTSVTVGSGGQPVTYDHVGMLIYRALGRYPGGRYVVL